MISTMLYITPTIILAATTALYIILTRRFKYWESRGVPVPFQPKIPFGNVSFKYSLPINFSNLYLKVKHGRFFGMYICGRPVFVPTDLDLIKSILIKDFSNFHDRGVHLDTKKEPLTGNLFALNGPEWRNLRYKLVPTFTSAKIKMMFNIIRDVGKHLEDVLEDCTKKPEIEVKDLMARYTIDVISSCAFGLDINSLKNPNAEFRKVTLDFMTPYFIGSIKILILHTAPKLAQYLPVTFIPEEVTKFFVKVVRDNMQYRKDNNIQRNDFFKLLIQLSKLGHIPDADNPVKAEDAKNYKKFTVEEAAAQAFVFQFAGFEVGAVTMTFALYELALQPDLQEKVQQEIDLVLSNRGQLTHDAMQEMDFLHRVVSETLRKYPANPFVFRECSSDYPIPDSNVILEKDTGVYVPTFGIHHNPELYPDPERFDPDRFLPEEVEKRHPLAYIPFGEGPRRCIGGRFALIQVKVGLIFVLSRFKVSPSQKTPAPPVVFSSKCDTLAFTKGLHLKISKR